MSNYILDIHYGKCHLADPETGIVINWEKGRFNETQESHTEGIIRVPENENLASFLARKLREMGDWLAQNHQELL